MKDSGKRSKNIKDFRGKEQSYNKMMDRNDDQISRMGGPLDERTINDYFGDMDKNRPAARDRIGKNLGFKDDKNPTPKKFDKKKSSSTVYTAQVTPGKFEMKDNKK